MFNKFAIEYYDASNLIIKFLQKSSVEKSQIELINEFTKDFDFYFIQNQKQNSKLNKIFENKSYGIPLRLCLLGFVFLAAFYFTFKQ